MPCAARPPGREGKGAHLHCLDRVKRAINRVDLFPFDRVRQSELVDDLDRLRLVERLAARDPERAEDRFVAGRKRNRHS